MTVENGKTFNDFYPSRWLKAADIPDENPIFTIFDVSAEQLGEDQEQKLVLMFKETTRHLALNKTNGSTLVELYGENPNDWISKRIEFFTEPVTYRGKATMAVRIKPNVPAELMEQPSGFGSEDSETWQD